MARHADFFPIGGRSTPAIDSPLVKGRVTYACLWSAAVQVVPHEINMQNARLEAEMVMFECVEKALKKCNLRPNQVPDVRIVMDFYCNWVVSIGAQFDALSLPA